MPSTWRSVGRRECATWDNAGGAGRPGAASIGGSAVGAGEAESRSHRWMRWVVGVATVAWAVAALVAPLHRGWTGRFSATRQSPWQPAPRGPVAGCRKSATGSRPGGLAAPVIDVLIRTLGTRWAAAPARLRTGAQLGDRGLQAVEAAAECREAGGHVRPELADL